jgi:hypothetical protein
LGVQLAFIFGLMAVVAALVVCKHCNGRLLTLSVFVMHW